VTITTVGQPVRETAFKIKVDIKNMDATSFNGKVASMRFELQNATWQMALRRPP
jgi:hypothetical protein